MKLISYGFSDKRYGIAIFDALGNIALDVQHVGNTIRECLPKLAKHAKEIPFASATIYKNTRKHGLVAVKQYDCLQTAKISML